MVSSFPDFNDRKVIDLAAVRALRRASGAPAPASDEPLDADRIILEAADALTRLTAENRQLRREVMLLTAKLGPVRDLLRQTAVGFLIGVALAWVLL